MWDYNMLFTYTLKSISIFFFFHNNHDTLKIYNCVREAHLPYDPTRSPIYGIFVASL